MNEIDLCKKILNMKSSINKLVDDIHYMIFVYDTDTIEKRYNSQDFYDKIFNKIELYETELRKMSYNKDIFRALRFLNDTNFVKCQ
jgi:hypothetical protein